MRSRETCRRTGEFNRRAGAGEGVFRDGGVVPDGGEEFVRGEALLGVAEEDEQYAEGLGLDGQNFACFRERKLALADFNVTDFEDCGLLADHGSIICVRHSPATSFISLPASAHKDRWCRCPGGAAVHQSDPDPSRN